MTSTAFPVLRSFVTMLQRRGLGLQLSIGVIKNITDWSLKYLVKDSKPFEANRGGMDAAMSFFPD